MSKTIEQKVKFDASPQALYNLYMDAKKHAAVIHGKVSITKKVGAKFSAFGSYIKGKNLHLVPNKMIVQTWRGSDWKKTDPDSVFVLCFEKSDRGTQMTMIHSNIPDKHVKGIRQGWTDYYWKPWKNYLKNR